MRKASLLKTVILLVAFLFLASMPCAWAATIKMRMVIVNPSTTKTQVKSIRSYLPKEVTLNDVVDSGGLDIEYDSEQGLLYVYKDIELAPSETKTFEIVLNDVWIIPDPKLESLQKRTEMVLDKLADTPYLEQADLLAKTIYGRLEEIRTTQNDPNVSRQQHIAYYRDNLDKLQGVYDDVERLEKILVTAGGPPNVELMEQTDVNLKAPSTKTTWILIFIILIFLAILGGAFYLTWQNQAKVTENIFTREKEANYADLKSGGQQGPGGGKGNP